MEKHQLALDIPNTLNKCIFRVVDVSIYSDLVPVECGTLYITPPGFTTSYKITDLDVDFTENITACQLGLQTTNCGNTYNDFPDGVYVVRWSVSPNDLVYVEYNHLRITTALNKINDLLCCLDTPACEPTTEIKNKLKEVQLLQTMLEAGKAAVEYCHTPGKGMDMYNYVMKKLNKLSCGCGCESCY